jgi:hypothetical protein
MTSVGYVDSLCDRICYTAQTVNIYVEEEVLDRGCVHGEVEVTRRQNETVVCAGILSCLKLLDDIFVVCPTVPITIGRSPRPHRVAASLVRDTSFSRSSALSATASPLEPAMTTKRRISHGVYEGVALEKLTPCQPGLNKIYQVR